MRHALLMLLLLTTPIALGCDDPPPGVPTSAPAVAAPLEYRGVALQLNDGTRPIERYGPQLEEIAELGANTVLLSVAGYMEHARSQSVFIEARKVPSQAQLKTLIQKARARGLNVLVMPIILLQHPRGSEWRGVIDPPDWPDWWRQYRDFITYFADVSQDAGAEGMLVGSELVSTEKYTSEWVRTVEAVRARFSGKLGYSANWDHYKPVKFWDKLDFISMTTYYTLADHKNPSIDEIVARWRPIRLEITNWRKTIGKPLIFTEVGWCSQEGAATAPWNYYQNMTASRAGLEEQRRLYEAFLRVWDGTPGIAGIIWWEWTDEPGGPSDFNYTPRGKPAEQVMRRWFDRGGSARNEAVSPVQP